MGAHLVGIIVHGSSARGEARTTSDVDVLVVVDLALALTRALYRRWDEIPVTWQGRRVAVQSGALAAMVLGQRGARTVPFGFEDEMVAALAKGDVDAAAVSPATVGYFNFLHREAPLVMHLDCHESDFPHVITLFKRHGYWGAISKTNGTPLRYNQRPGVLNPDFVVYGDPDPDWLAALSSNRRV